MSEELRNRKRESERGRKKNSNRLVEEKIYKETERRRKEKKSDFGRE